MGKVTGYAEAVRVVLDLATQNQIDERDIAFGDDGMADDARMQSAALTTVQSFVDGVGHDYPVAPKGKVPSVDLPDTEGEPDPENLRDAFRVVLDMADGNVLEDDEPSMKAEVRRQERSVELVRHLMATHPDILVAPAAPGMR